VKSKCQNSAHVRINTSDEKQPIEIPNDRRSRISQSVRPTNNEAVLSKQDTQKVQFAQPISNLQSDIITSVSSRSIIITHNILVSVETNFLIIETAVNKTTYIHSLQSQ
jgi:hypothetical protein